MERNEATEPVTNAGIALLKKNSAIDTRMKHAIICCLVLLTDRYSVTSVMPVKHPKKNKPVRASDRKLTENSWNSYIQIINLLRVGQPNQVI